MAGVQEQTQKWIQDILAADSTDYVDVKPVKQGWGILQFGKSIYQNEPLSIHGREFAWGFGHHADGEIILCGAPIARLTGYVGVDANTASRNYSAARIEFWIETDGKVLWRSPVLTIKDEAIAFDISLNGSRKITLKCRAVDGNIDFAHADWAQLVATTCGGAEIKLGEIQQDSPLRARIPLSFDYDGHASQDFLAGWRKQKESRKFSDNATLHTLRWTDPKTLLECTLEMKEYSDFPAAEWVVYFRNTGNQDTPIIENILPLDISSPNDNDVMLHRSHGSLCSSMDFVYSHDPLPQDKPIIMTPEEGRSSAQWLPFFNLAMQKKRMHAADFVNPLQPDHGTIVAIGWTGHWQARFDKSVAGTLCMQAGMSQTHLRLHPGETIRTPSILLLNWAGQPIDGNNLLRRFILKYHSPMPDGKPIVPPICNGSWGGMKSQAHLERIRLYAEKKLPYDYYWIDAGWYGPADSYSPDEHKGDWATHVGNWNVNPVAHPEGLKPLSDAMNKAGMKFLLWFEPERAVWGTPLTQEHPEWFLGNKTAKNNVLLDLGNPAARTWLIDFMSKMIQDNNIGCYRQDFNFDPLPFWRAADAPDRVGMTEIRHIEGLYEFWDALLLRNPGLIIDNCASGGRRIDMETISRSIPLWRSDVQCFAQYDPDLSQSQTLGLNIWVPLNAAGTQVGPGDTYRFRSCISSGIDFPLFGYEYYPIDEKYPYEWHRRMMLDFVRARPLMLGNFYPLTPFQLEKEVWTGFQCHRTDLDEGVVVAFRRAQCPYSVAQFPLNDLDAAARYEIENADSGRRETVSGERLMREGVSVTLDRPRSSCLIFYRQIPG